MYTAQYHLAANTDEPTRDAIAAIDYPQTLDDVRDTCRALGVSATLLDATGRTRGYVHSDGTYALR